ncbi:uncharacterized protein LOC110457937 isoform X1 [Mizuhopecten yessoensis]|uniref:uncharacterized protein LOC110457937 isoform X1 n=2 Tax=Mizuhopecten yessoensis TaxID=6573 RepID=UPI000B45BA14|nr:uncharacterized protein LOC110457937 isoform X1 [Mizuhopecten yessoensis]XP_021365106.1 uncharacterized protein LOC110457937 isoform X1 [Mizuhopecten yessoensis]
MSSIRTKRSYQALVSILDLTKVQLTASDIQEPTVITTPGSNVHILAEPLLRHCEHPQMTDSISVKTFMSKQGRFGNVGFYEQFCPVPKEFSNTSFVKSYSVTAILQKRGEPYAKFNGNLQMWRSDKLARLLPSSDSRHKGYEKTRKDDVHSRKFLSKVRSFHKCQEHQHNTQTEFGDVNVSVHIELVSLYLTDLCSRGLFPPTPHAGHTHFTLPSTEPILFYPQYEIVWNSVMRLLSFLYAPNDNYLYPIIARAGFYLVDQSGSVCCSECDCLCSIAVFEEGNQSEFDKHHKLGCMHRQYRKEDCDLPQRRPETELEAPHRKIQNKAPLSQTDLSRSQGEADSVSHQCEIEVAYNGQGEAECLKRQSESMKTPGCISKQYRNIGQHKSSKQRSLPITTPGILNQKALYVSLQSDIPIVDGSRTSNMIETKEPNEQISPDFISRRKRNDTLLLLKLKLQLRKALVENGFFYDGRVVRCCCCKIIYEIPSCENPSQFHARKNPACQYLIGGNYTQKVCDLLLKKYTYNMFIICKFSDTVSIVLGSVLVCSVSSIF